VRTLVSDEYADADVLEAHERLMRATPLAANVARAGGCCCCYCVLFFVAIYQAMRRSPQRLQEHKKGGFNHGRFFSVNHHLPCLDFLSSTHAASCKRRMSRWVQSLVFLSQVILFYSFINHLFLLLSTMHTYFLSYQTLTCIPLFRSLVVRAPSDGTPLFWRALLAEGSGDAGAAAQDYLSALSLTLPIGIQWQAEYRLAQIELARTRNNNSDNNNSNYNVNSGGGAGVLWLRRAVQRRPSLAAHLLGVKKTLKSATKTLKSAKKTLEPANANTDTDIISDADIAAVADTALYDAREADAAANAE
jgi:hypothetical protein